MDRNEDQKKVRFLEKYPSETVKVVEKRGKWEWLRQAALKLTAEQPIFEVVVSSEREANSARGVIRSFSKTGTFQKYHPDKIVKTHVVPKKDSDTEYYLYVELVGITQYTKPT